MRCRSMILAAVFLLAATVRNVMADEQEDAKALPHFVGNWLAHSEDKPSKLVPDGRKFDVQQAIGWTLKKRFIVGHEIRSDGIKTLWLMTYDPKSQSYPFWLFGHDVFGGEWNSTWDDATNTLTGKATDTPQGWTSHGVNHFPDAKTDEFAGWMKDDSGNLIFESITKKTRLPEAAGEKILADWSKPGKANPALPQSPELKVLDRMIGDWDTKNDSKVAVWTPEEKHWTSKLTRQWVLDGHFVQENSQDSTSEEGLSLVTFDSREMTYRGWWFSSEGHTAKNTGTWDEAKQTFSFKSDLEGGLTVRSTWKFTDKDHHDVTVVVTDGDGKTYFDTTWAASRRK